MDPKFVVNLSGKEYPLFAGILAEAHERGLQAIETELLQIPGSENEYTAIVKATVRMKDGSVFQDYGDANPRNTNARIATALIRMASTRAKGRALRDAINVGQTMLEELPDLDDHGHAAPPMRYETEPRPRSVVADGAPAPTPARSAAANGDTATAAGSTRASTTGDATPAASPRAATNGDGKLQCSNPTCNKPLTKGQYDISTRAYGQPFCPGCQKVHAKVG